MTDEELRWIKTNNSVCALLKQVHDVLALTSLPPRREWVGLTDDEKAYSNTDYLRKNAEAWHGGVEWAEAKLKEKNG